MATFIITFFLITQFYVCKMDADFRKRRRNIAQREKRWSMNSQRLEEIVAELMKPIGDVHRSFDTDLSALLEEYLTEAGLHALDEGDAGGAPTPNFAELALLLQQSASIYGRKVDCLYSHVLCVSDALHNNAQESSGAGESPAGAGAGESARRKRKASAGAEFARLRLEAGGAARREPGPPRPPPTLPRMYLELEPRVVRPQDHQLRDYLGEPIGLLADYHVAWRLRDGRLVDELAEGAGAGGLRAAPPSPPPASPRAPSRASRAATPPASPLDCSTPLPDRKERKRRSEVRPEDAPEGRIELLISEELRGKLRRVEEFSVPPRWVARVVEARARALRATRRTLTHHREEFRGFDISDSMDVGGFLGWSSSEAAAAKAALSAAGGARAEESDDDGFFEQSSLGDSDTSRVDDTAATALSSLPGSGCEWWEWREAVLSRSAAAAARGADVSAAARALLGAAGALPQPAACDALLRSRDHGVAELFLSALFLADAGNIEIVPGPPLSVNSFAVRVLSTDTSQFRAAPR